jgi:hypothetical protein
MRKFLMIVGWLLAVVGCLLVLLGIECLPPGGLMFALPYFFFIPGFALLVSGGIVLLLTRIMTRSSQGAKMQDEGANV